MKFVAGLLATVLLLMDMAAGRAVVRITDDGGGRIGTYIAKFQSLRSSSEMVIIDGPCFSACTLILGSVPDDRICVTSRARFGFHAAYDLGSTGGRITNREATELMYSMYPTAIQNWLNEHGGLTPRLILLRGDELQAIYRRCEPGRSGVSGALQGAGSGSK